MVCGWRRAGLCAQLLCSRMPTLQAPAHAAPAPHPCAHRARPAPAPSPPRASPCAHSARPAPPPAPAVLRRQPTVLLGQHPRALRAKAEALQGLLGCCSEALDTRVPQGHAAAAAMAAAVAAGGSPSWAGRRIKAAMGGVEGAGAKWPVKETRGRKASAKSGSSSDASAAITLSHVLSVAPCLWGYRTETTR